MENDDDFQKDFENEVKNDPMKHVDFLDGAIKTSDSIADILSQALDQSLHNKINSEIIKLRLRNSSGGVAKLLVKLLIIENSEESKELHDKIMETRWLTEWFDE